jgi:hypothetical protein
VIVELHNPDVGDVVPVYFLKHVQFLLLLLSYSDFLSSHFYESLYSNNLLLILKLMFLIFGILHFLFVNSIA